MTLKKKTIRIVVDDPEVGKLVFSSRNPHTVSVADVEGVRLFGRYYRFGWTISCKKGKWHGIDQARDRPSISLIEADAQRLSAGDSLVVARHLSLVVLSHMAQVAADSGGLIKFVTEQYVLEKRKLRLNSLIRQWQKMIKEATLELAQVDIKLSQFAKQPTGSILE